MSVGENTIQAFFLPVGGSKRFCLFHEPRGAFRGALLHVHAFAEEMNLSRRMVALQARSLTAAGYAVLQMDLFGCGDSEGDFGDATWSAWMQDVVAAAKWLEARTGDDPILWGVRAGCLLAVEVARAMARPARFLFWQPVVSGAVHWRQFLRIQLAGAIIAETEVSEGDRSGEVANRPASNEVAGYHVSQELIDGLTLSRLDLAPTRAQVVCIELTANGDHLTPLLTAQIEDWRAMGHQVYGAALPGAAFWQSADTPECPALVETTTRLVTSEWS